MSQIEFKVVASTTAEAVAQLQALVLALGGTPLAAQVAQVAQTADAKVQDTTAADEAKVTATADAPKRTRRSTKVTQEAPAAEANEPELSYDADVRPILVKLSSHKDGGRDAAKEIVASFKVKNGTDIPVEKLAEAKKLAEAALAKLEAGVEAEDDDEFSV